MQHSNLCTIYLRSSDPFESNLRTSAPLQTQTFGETSIEKSAILVKIPQTFANICKHFDFNFDVLLMLGTTVDDIVDLKNAAT